MFGKHCVTGVIAIAALWIVPVRADMIYYQDFEEDLVQVVKALDTETGEELLISGSMPADKMAGIEFNSFYWEGTGKAYCYTAQQACENCLTIYRIPQSGGIAEELFSVEVNNDTTIDAADHPIYKLDAETLLIHGTKIDLVSQTATSLTGEPFVTYDAQSNQLIVLTGPGSLLLIDVETGTETTVDVPAPTECTGMNASTSSSRAFPLPGSLIYRPALCTSGIVGMFTAKSQARVIDYGKAPAEVLRKDPFEEGVSDYRTGDFLFAKDREVVRLLNNQIVREDFLTGEELGTIEAPYPMKGWDNDWETAYRGRKIFQGNSAFALNSDPEISILEDGNIKTAYDVTFHDTDYQPSEARFEYVVPARPETQHLRGTGPEIPAGMHLLMAPDGQRLYAIANREIVAIDIPTGNRTLITDAMPQEYTTYAVGPAVELETSRGPGGVPSEQELIKHLTGKEPIDAQDPSVDRNVDGAVDSGDVRTRQREQTPIK